MVYRKHMSYNNTNPLEHMCVCSVLLLFHIFPLPQQVRGKGNKKGCSLVYVCVYCFDYSEVNTSFPKFTGLEVLPFLFSFSFILDVSREF